MSPEPLPPIVSFVPAIIGVGGGFIILLFSVPFYLWPPKPGGLIKAAGESWVSRPENKTAILRHTCRVTSHGAIGMIVIGALTLFVNLAENPSWVFPLSVAPFIAIIVPSIQSLFFARDLKKEEERERLTGRDDGRPGQRG